MQIPISLLAKLQPPRKPVPTAPESTSSFVSGLVNRPIPAPLPPPRPPAASPAELVNPSASNQNSMGLATPRFIPRPPVPPAQGYRAQAEEVLGTQKKRGFGGVVKDILTGFAGGGVGGAILGGVKGGDYRRENQITATAGDLREADQVQRQNQIDTNTRDRYADQREDLLTDRDSRQALAEAEEKRRSAAFDLDQQIKQQQLKNVQQPNFDMVWLRR